MVRETTDICKVKTRLESKLRCERKEVIRDERLKREREWVIVDRPNTKQRDNWYIPVGELLLNIITSFVEVLRQWWWPSTAEENSTLRAEVQQCHFFFFWWYYSCMFFGTGLNPVSEKHLQSFGHHGCGQWNMVLIIREELCMQWLINRAKIVNG